MDEKLNPKEVAQAFQPFWDMGFKLGLVTRTLKECKNILGDEIASDMALLEMRYLGGARDLFENLKDKILKPYFTSHKGKISSLLLQHLQEGLYSDDNSMYRVEPHLKNGVCTLRDCHRIGWLLKLLFDIRKYSEIEEKSSLRKKDIHAFSVAYDYMLSLRNELHMINGRRMDVLETASQPDIALALGHGKKNPHLFMKEFYLHANSIRNMALALIEKTSTENNFLFEMRRKITATRLPLNLCLLDGIIYPEKSAHLKLDPTWIMQLFLQTVHTQSHLCRELREKVRLASDSIEQSECRTIHVSAFFRNILLAPHPIGHTISEMHDCGFLAKFLSEFTELHCMVQYTTYHEYTADQHIILCMKSLDHISKQQHELHSIYAGLSKAWILRLGLLLH
ncbi:MAG: hypothetical protein HQL32_12490, partial [Planctomycetes bacterium]|nr:hypothetical protein [Planctomycetota bacterium]